MESKRSLTDRSLLLLWIQKFWLWFLGVTLLALVDFLLISRCAAGEGACKVQRGVELQPWLSFAFMLCMLAWTVHRWGKRVWLPTTVGLAGLEAVFFQSCFIILLRLDWTKPDFSQIQEKTSASFFIFFASRTINPTMKLTIQQTFPLSSLNRRSFHFGAVWSELQWVSSFHLS